jgi:hypothetical protein
VSEFLLLGARPPAPDEASLGGIARDVMAQTAWHWWLRRWGTAAVIRPAAGSGW